MPLDAEGITVWPDVLPDANQDSINLPHPFFINRLLTKEGTLLPLHNNNNNNNNNNTGNY